MERLILEERLTRRRDKNYSPFTPCRVRFATSAA